MKIFWYEIKIEKTNKAKSYRWATTNSWDVPPTTTQLFYSLYKKNSDLRRCINEIQETTWLYWYRIINENWDEINDEKINLILNNFQEIKNLIIRDIIVAWHCFILKETNNFWQIVNLDTIDPRTVYIVANEYWDILKYIQKVKWQFVEFSNLQINQEKLESDPDNEIFWLSVIEWLSIDILADNESALSNYHFFKNWAIPSSLIILEDWLDQNDEEIKQIIENMKKQFSWWKNKHKNSILSWIKDIKQLQQTMTDMQFTVLRWFTTERICAWLWVPKVILNYTDWVNYTNADMQYKKFIENTIKPRERRIQKIFTKIIQEINPNARLEILDDHINNIEEKTKVIIEQIKYWLITTNEWREELWYDVYDIEEANIPLISNNLNRLEDVWLNTISTNLNEIP